LFAGHDREIDRRQFRRWLRLCFLGKASQYDETHCGDRLHVASFQYFFRPTSLERYAAI
jgi:hypothetical protein